MIKIPISDKASDLVVANGKHYIAVTQDNQHIVYSVDLHTCVITKTALATTRNYITLQVWHDGTMVTSCQLRKPIKPDDTKYIWSLWRKGKIETLPARYSLVAYWYPALSPYDDNLALITNKRQAVIVQWPTMKVISSALLGYTRVRDMVWIGKHHAQFATSDNQIIDYHEGRVRKVAAISDKYAIESMGATGEGAYIFDKKSQETFYYSYRNEKQVFVAKGWFNFVYIHHGQVAVLQPTIYYEGSQNVVVLFDTEHCKLIKRMQLPHDCWSIASDHNVTKQGNSISMVKWDTKSKYAEITNMVVM